MRFDCRICLFSFPPRYGKIEVRKGLCELSLTFQHYNDDRRCSAFLRFKGITFLATPQVDDWFRWSLAVFGRLFVCFWLVR